MCKLPLFFIYWYLHTKCSLECCGAQGRRLVILFCVSADVFTDRTTIAGIALSINPCDCSWCPRKTDYNLKLACKKQLVIMSNKSGAVAAWNHTGLSLEGICVQVDLLHFKSWAILVTPHCLHFLKDTKSHRSLLCRVV